MNYQEALDYLQEASNLGSRLGLDTIKQLLHFLGNPQKKIKFIHVGGTNGKGSTSSYLSYALEASGYKVGLFTSPHMLKYNESIKINQVDISDDRFSKLINQIKEQTKLMVEEGLLHPTTFEIITALAILYFREENVDFVIMEVGLGGREDSTNIIPAPLATVFTSISYDHIDFLGDTLEKIAYEKSGIIKEGTMVISYPQEKEVEYLLKEVSQEKNVEFHMINKDDIKIEELGVLGGKFNYKYGDETLTGIQISMLGEHQIYNASLALNTLLTLKSKGLINIQEKEIKEGFLKTRLAGRLEILRETPVFLIDGAHNLQGVEQLVKSIKMFKYRKLILGIGILKDKDTSHMVELLAPLADQIIVTEVNNPRKLEAEILAGEIYKYKKDVHVEKDIKESIKKALELAEKDDIILFAGSLYLIGEIRALEKLL